MARSATSKAERTRQVQFRMDPDTFKRLHTAVINDDDIHSIADLFNFAAQAYLNRPKEYTALVSKMKEAGDD